jgi:hypothetical protein
VCVQIKRNVCTQLLLLASAPSQVLALQARLNSPLTKVPFISNSKILF